MKAGIHIVILIGLFSASGCISLQQKRVHQPNSCIQAVIHVTKVGQQYKVEAKVFEFKASDPIILSDSISDVTQMMQHYSSADMLSTPPVTTPPDKWSEIRVCATNSLGVFEGRATIGKEEVIIYHPPGILLRVMVSPSGANTAKAQGVISIGSEDTKTAHGYHRFHPFNVECTMGKDTVLFRSTYIVTGAYSFYPEAASRNLRWKDETRTIIVRTDCSEAFRLSLSDASEIDRMSPDELIRLAKDLIVLDRPREAIEVLEATNDKASPKNKLDASKLLTYCNNNIHKKEMSNK